MVYNLYVNVFVNANEVTHKRKDNCCVDSLETPRQILL